jgi:hypothetical protein
LADNLLGSNSLGKKYIFADNRFVQEDRFIDVFKRPIEIKFDGDAVSLRSAGANGEFGDEDDYAILVEIRD